ncbi:hypothetical protein DICVIV_03344 [Dictyocaulus viviparus]|uniref:GST C-terminal domain-containing protein n=1 Tax=Dictyocaulus viviparus TaxID=29172 RepID=A0A0D8Y395_DICVI|nr:hypothetical protein DICVIV_03344 [Dictyocaulus viviparus]
MCLSVLAVVIVVVTVIAKFFFVTKKSAELRKNDWKPDVVYLYQFPRCKEIPNLSPFCLKVETFLKVNKIPHEAKLFYMVTHEVILKVSPLVFGRSKYGLLPFVELNGEQIADSQIIISRLAKHFNVKSLSSARNEAIVRFVDRTADNHTFLLHCTFKMMENDFFSMLLRNMGVNETLLPILSPILGFMMKWKVATRVSSGIGQLAIEEYRELLRKDYDSYRDLLGEQKFMFGDEITTADCTVFGQLATILYISTTNYASEVLRDEYPTLVAFCNRVRDAAFGNEFVIN